LIYITKNTQGFYFFGDHFNPMLSFSLNPLLLLFLPPLCLTPLSVLAVPTSYKYANDLMRGYDCNKLIEPERVFHLEIAHNTTNLKKEKITNLMHDDIHRWRGRGNDTPLP
jgi:hypothetical protein